MLCNFSCFCCRLLPFWKFTFSKKYFRNTIKVSNGLDPDQDRWSQPQSDLIWVQTVAQVISRQQYSPLARIPFMLNSVLIMLG